MEDKLYWYRGVVRRLYDADTIYVDLDLGFGIIRRGENGKGFPVRLARIDAPEIRSDERPQGLEAKAFLEGLLPPGTVVYLHTVDWSGKYGRWIAEVYLESDLHINDHLVKNGHAKYIEY